MKKVIFLFIVIATAIIAVSCGHSDEPDPVKPDEITRVKDGNGKVFLENGVLVDANIDYTSAELSKALTENEWYFDYGFYYDNSHSLILRGFSTHRFYYRHHPYTAPDPANASAYRASPTK